MTFQGRFVSGLTMQEAVQIQAQLADMITGLQRQVLQILQRKPSQENQAELFRYRALRWGLEEEFEAVAAMK